MRAATGALTAICRAQQARLIEIERERVALRLSAALGERPDAPVLIWGTGTKGREVAARLARLPRRPRAFIDSASERWGQQVDGVPVMSPDDALRTRDPLVVVASMYADEIGQMLRTRGVHDFVVAP
jgi:FlaA1/EpsC-like NDP-sugar epimerase